MSYQQRQLATFAHTAQADMIYQQMQQPHPNPNSPASWYSQPNNSSDNNNGDSSARGMDHPY